MTEVRKRTTKRKASGASDALLFETVAESRPRARQVVVLSSNFTLGPLLARGALLPEALEGNALVSSATPLRLQWSTGALPADWIDTLLESARNVIPIAIRLSSGRGVRRVSIAGCHDIVDCVCMSDVDGLAFRSDKERIRFESLEFSNYELADTGLNLSVDLPLFEGPRSIATASTREAPESTEPSPVFDAPPGVFNAATMPVALEAVQSVRSVDCRSGLLAFLLAGSPGRRAWMEGVQRLFAKRSQASPTSLPERIVAAALGTPFESTSIEMALLRSTVTILRRHPVESGWPAEQILGDVKVAVRADGASLDERAFGELDRWSARASDVLASKTEPQSLADDGFIIQRAILLLLLRGDLDALDAGHLVNEGPLRPGPQVFATAGALAAFRTGLRAMPARYKTATDQGHLLGYLGEVFVGMLQEGGQPALVPAPLPKPDVQYRSIRALQGEWITTLSSKEVLRRPAEFESGLERLLTMGRHLGFEFEEHGERGLRTQMTQADGRRRPVYLELIKTEKPGGAMVRFSAPTLKLAGVNPRLRLTRELAFEMLRRNADPNMYCRFAIDDDATQVIVLVDQLLATLDEAEFTQHLHHIAQTAEGFELSRTVGDNAVR